MKIIIFNKATANLNCSYANKVLIDKPEILQEAVKSDHVCAEFMGNNRSIENFQSSNVLLMEIDNEQAEKPEAWITPKKLNQLLPDISYAIVSLKGRTAKPKFRVYFQIAETNNFEFYEELKKEFKKRFGFLGGAVLDVTNTIFGAETDEVIWHEGKLTIEKLFLEVYWSLR